MPERRLKPVYNEMYIVGSFDLLHPDHKTFLSTSIDTAAANTSFDKVVIGLDSDKLLRSRKGALSPLFSYDWRKEDLNQWSTSSGYDNIHIEEAIPTEEQHKKTRLVVLSSEYQNSPTVAAAQESGVDILFVPPVHTLHTSDSKRALLDAQDSANCEIRKVGAVLLREGVLQDVGSSGGDPDSCKTCPKYLDVEEQDATIGKQGISAVPCVVPHAEVQAMERAQNGDDLLITVAPCSPCSELIVEKGIRRVVFVEPYRDNAPFEYLAENGVQIRQAGYRPKN